MKTFTGQKSWLWGAFLSPPVRWLCNSTKRTQTKHSQT